MEKSNQRGVLVVGGVFALSEIFIVVGESLGWISYNMDLDPFLFIIFLIFIVSYRDKNYKNKINYKKIFTVESQNVKN